MENRFHLPRDWKRRYRFAPLPRVLITKVRTTGRYVESTVTFLAGKDTYRGTYYRPAGRGPFPAVLVLPHLAARADLLEGYFCRGLAERGIASLLLYAAFHEDRPGERGVWLTGMSGKDLLEEIPRRTHRSVAQADQAAAWLGSRPEIRRDSLGIMGISFGGVVAVVAAGATGRFRSAAYLLSGGDLPRMVLGSSMTRGAARELTTSGLSRDLFSPDWQSVEPLNFSGRARGMETLVMGACFDRVIPRVCVSQLWEGLGRPRARWVPTGHLSAALFLPYVRSEVVSHFSRTLAR